MLNLKRIKLIINGIDLNNLMNKNIIRKRYNIFYKNCKQYMHKYNNINKANQIRLNNLIKNNHILLG